MSGVITFLESPLVTWVKTFSLGKETVTFQDVSDAVYLLDVLNAIDERNTDEDVLKKLQRFAKDPNARLQNWALLMHSLTAYYLEVLQQAVVMKIPDVFSIVEDPTQDRSLADLQKVLLLLLGCAVQCERKEHHIEAIKCLDISAQKALVDCIKQVTDSGENVIPLDSYGDCDDTKQLYQVIRRNVVEKDQLLQRMIQLKQERDYHANEVSKKCGELSAPPSLENYHLLREMQGCKAKIQQAQREIEEKGKAICDLKEELQLGEKEIAKVKTEKLRLEKDARLARTYRDEVDTLKEQALKAEKYEKELCRYKEKVHEMEYYKSRVEELREDNSVLAECKEKLEVQTSTSQCELSEVRREVDRLTGQLAKIDKEKCDVEQKLSEALDENAALDFEKARMTEGAPLRRMVSYTSSEFLQASQQQIAGQPICEELSASMSSHVTRLEVENVELKHELEQIKCKLSSTQQEVETLLTQSQHDYNKRLQKGDTRLHREERIAELTNTLTQKQQELEACEGKLFASERGRKGQERQVARVEEQWHAAQRKCEDLSTEVKQLHRELQEARRRDGSIQESREEIGALQRDKQDLIQETKHLHRDKANLAQETKQLHRELQETRRRMSSVQDKAEELAVVQRDKENLVQETKQLQRELQQARRKINSVQDKAEELAVVQRDKEDLVQQLSSLHGQVTKEKEQHISLQRDNNDLMQRLSIQQSHWDRDREGWASLERERTELQAENNQLRHNLDSVRECSEQHIKELEEQVAALQDKSVAIENLNDYLNNLSMVDNSQEVVIDTDLDAHLDFSNAKDNNHNDKPGHSAVEKSEWKSQEVEALPQCSSTPRTGRRHEDRAASMSLCEVDEYAIDSSQLYGNDRPTKLTYVKRNASFTTSSQESERSASNNFINKLKSYVKPYNKTVQSKPNDSREHQRTPLQEVQLREDRNFVRNSRHRSTVHGQPMTEKSPSLRREKLRTPVTHATSRPASAAFSRGHTLRQSMPERRRQARPSEHSKSGTPHHHSNNNSSQQSLISQDSPRSRSSSQSSHQHPASVCHKDYSSDLDSGLGASAEHYQAARGGSGNPTADQTDGGHSVTSIEVTSRTERIESHWQRVSTSRGPEASKWEGMVERVRRLEEQNQALTRENGDLKKTNLDSRGSLTTTSSLQKRLQQLEAENRKLRIIVETLQNTLSGRNPYDDKEYHYFTNV